MQYNVTIQHKPELLNKADALSRWLDYPQGTSKAEIAFPPNIFLNTSTIQDSWGAILNSQLIHNAEIDTLSCSNSLHNEDGVWYFNSHLIVPEDNDLR